VIDDAPDFGVAENNTRILAACLRQLQRLECLALQECPALVLPDGPWQGTVRQLAADAEVLQASRPELQKAAALHELCMGVTNQHPAVPSLLRWATALQTVPLRRLVLAFSARVSPTVDTLQAGLGLMGRPTLLDVQTATSTSDMPLHSFLAG